MWPIQLSWKNIWRNKNRTLVTVSAVAFATFISVLASGLKEGIFGNLIHDVVSSYSGHVQVHLKGYQDEQVIENSFAVSPSMKQEIQAIPGVILATERLESFALASSGENTKGCLVIGIEKAEESSFMNIGSKIIAGRTVAENEKSILVPEGLAKRMKLQLQDTLILIGQGYHGASAAGKYVISGMLRFGSPKMNERLIIMPIGSARELFGAEGISTSLAILLDPRSRPESVAEKIKTITGKNHEVLTWGEIMPDIKQHIDADSGNMQYVQYILYALVGLGIFSTLLIMVAERSRENGMLLCLGMSKRMLQQVFLLESLITVLLGALMGLLISLPVMFYLKWHPLRISGTTAEAYKKFGFEPIFPTSTDPSIFLKQGVTVLVMGLILSLYPIWRIATLHPLSSMKK
jgi:ABC-type lipoprotein release transport system permease subunit